MPLVLDALVLICQPRKNVIAVFSRCCNRIALSFLYSARNIVSSAKRAKSYGSLSIILKFVSRFIDIFVVPEKCLLFIRKLYSKTFPRKQNFSKIFDNSSFFLPSIKVFIVRNLLFIFSKILHILQNTKFLENIHCNFSEYSTSF